MALTPMIVIGCGGSGGKVVVGLRQRLEVELRRRGWTEGIPEAWQLLYVDTPGAQEVNLDYGAPLPVGDYISTSKTQTTYAPIDQSVARYANSQSALDRLTGWRPAHDLPVPVSTGAGQWRAVGRLVAFHGLADVAAAVRRALNACHSGRSQLQRLGEKVGDDTAPDSTPFVVVVSSMAGGTGAGMFIDVCDVMRAVEPDLNDRLMAVLFTAEVFQNLKSGTGLQPNTVGVLSEMMAGYLDRNRGIEPLYNGLIALQQHELAASGPSYPFVLGMSTLSGTPLTDISDCYRAATETLASAMMNPRIYKDLLEFQITNWSNNALPNMSAWEFGNPAYGDGSRRPAGMVSSFGSSRLSVGTTLFGEYAVHRMTRSIMDFLIDGYLTEGRQLLQDPTATREEVLEYFRTERGLAFVEACGLRELNDDDVVYDQVLEEILPTDDLNAIMRTWVSTLTAELSTVGTTTKGQWLGAIGDIVPRRVSSVINPVLQRCDQGIQDLALTLPDRVITETARVMNELGVPVARELVVYAQTHLRAAVRQLRMEAVEERRRGESWRDAAGRAVSDLQDKDRIDANHPLIGGSDGAIKRSTSQAYREARAIARERTADFIEALDRQVLGPLVGVLGQLNEQLADPDLRAVVSRYPSDSGVPSRFAPTPLDFPLIDAEDWPRRYKQLVEETALAEKDQDFRAANPDSTVRRMVGGGGFTLFDLGKPRTVGVALTLEAKWSLDRAVAFTTQLSVHNVEERARQWLGRTDTAIGGFIAQDLDTYLKPNGPDGSPIPDHVQRMEKFKDQLSAALSAATPLVSIDQNVFERVHPNSRMKDAMTTLDVQPLPVTGRAREAAERILAPFVGDSEGKELDDFFTDGTSRDESVLIVSQLAGAVHPSCVMSLTSPIAAAWNKTKVSPQTVDAFWQYRRARILPEAIPVAPTVLHQMIKGYFLARAFGALPDPEQRGRFVIGTGSGEASFVWPILRWGHQGDTLLSRGHQFEWLPAILETLGLAYMLVPTEPGVLDAYDTLYKLGVSATPRMDAWVMGGSIPEAIGPPLLTHGGTPETAVEALRAGLTGTRTQYQQRLDGATLDASPDTFYSIDYGYTLYRPILSALGDLISAIPSPRSDAVIL